MRPLSLAIEALRARFSGDLVGPSDAGYNSARRVWNGTVDRRPLLIAYCTNVDDVIRSVAFARETGVATAVRSGRHSIAGLCVADDALVIDLSRMNKVTVDPIARTARAEGGALLRDLDAATQAHGLATTTGVNSDTGLIGLTLGGGIGRLGRKHGLSCDNMITAEIVTAGGQLLSASEAENAELFWGLRGGGGNFGIVTSATYRLHRVGPTVLAGLLVYDWKRARDALRRFAEVSAEAPDELCLDGALHTLPDGGRGFSISAFYAGEIADGERALRRLRDKTPAIADCLGPARYVQVQKGGDDIFAHGCRYHLKAQLLDEISDETIDTLIEQFPSVPSPRSLFVFQQLGGAIARIPAAATAYANRTAAYDAFAVSIWTEPARDAANVFWTREVYESLRPFATGGVYVNNLGDEGFIRVRAAYGQNYDRLVSLKRRYDPDNLFRSNQNIAIGDDWSRPRGGSARRTRDESVERLENGSVQLASSIPRRSR